MLTWLRQLKEIGVLKEQAKKDKRAIDNLKSMNHELIQTLNTIPAKHRKGLTNKPKAPQK